MLLASLEFIRARFLTGFPFLLVAHTQHSFLPLIQITDITGAYGLTFLLAMVNGLIAELILTGLRNRRSARKIIVAGALLCLALTYGAAKFAAYDITPLDLDEPTPSRRILSVQGNVPIDLKHSDSQEQILANLARHARLSLAAVGKNVDLIIWPETMLAAQLNLAWNDEILLRIATKPKLATLLERLKASRDALKNTLAKTHSHMLIGSETLTLGEKPKRYNSAYLLSPEGNILGRYDKIHLVVFGEYTPFENVFPFLKKLRPPQMGESLSAGETRRLFELPKAGQPPAKFGVTICYEDSVATLFRKFVNDGADFMVNITNDGWFKNSSELDIHLAVCAFRAAENHIPIVRCANTGISAFIARTGRITKALTASDGRRREVEGTLLHNVSLVKRPGFYTRYGDIFAWLCIAALALLLILPLLPSRRRNSRPS